MPGATHDQRPTRMRWWVVLLLFEITAINYADRATISIVGPQLAHDLKLDSVALGYLLSAFSVSYVTMQIPGGWLLDRFGSRLVYLGSIITWSAFTALRSFVGLLGGTRIAARTLYGLRLLLRAAEAPSFPANSRIVAAWFPAPERGTAAAIFNSAQYFSIVIFYPVMGLITHHLGWQYVFWTMGALGLVFAMIWPRVVHAPREHPRANAAELALIEEGGGLVDLDHGSAAGGSAGVLGAALGKGYVEAGARVASLDLAEDRPAEMAAELGSEHRGVGIDVLEKESVEKAFEFCTDAFGRVDILVNGAGGNHPNATTNPDMPFFEISKQSLEFVAGLNLIGTILPSQVFGKHMAQEYSTDIRVNAIAPGFFLTDQNRFLLTDQQTGELTPRGRQILDHTPQGRFGAPEDLVGTAVWLVSDAAKFVSGIVVPVDGGFSAFSGV